MAKVLGIKELERNFSLEMARIKRATSNGIVKAAEKLKKDMVTTPPSIPEDYGNLKESYYIATRVSNRADSPSFEGPNAYKLKIDHETTVTEAMAIASSHPPPVVVIGFSAWYAMSVHEMDGNVNWSKPGSGPWFFQAGLKRNRDMILQTVRNNIKRR